MESQYRQVGGSLRAPAAPPTGPVACTQMPARHAPNTAQHSTAERNTAQRNGVHAQPQPPPQRPWRCALETRASCWRTQNTPRITASHGPKKQSAARPRPLLPQALEMCAEKKKRILLAEHDAAREAAAGGPKRAAGLLAGLVSSVQGALGGGGGGPGSAAAHVRALKQELATWETLASVRGPRGGRGARGLGAAER